MRLSLKRHRIRFSAARRCQREVSAHIAAEEENTIVLTPASAMHSNSATLPETLLSFVILERLLHRLPHRFQAGEMDHRIEALLCKQLSQRGAIAHIDLCEPRPPPGDALDAIERPCCSKDCR